APASSPVSAAGAPDRGTSRTGASAHPGRAHLPYDRSIAMTDAAPSPPAAPSPWDRFGWLMGGIWLLFLGFPLVATLTASLAPCLKITAIALLAAFGAVYVYGFARLRRARGHRQQRWLVLAAMVLLALAFGLIIGVDALGLVAYLVAFGMFTQPLRRALWMTVGWLTLT